MSRVAMVLVVGLLIGLAGCTGEPAARPVDFTGVDDSQRGADFTLVVKVVGVDNDTLPLAGAFVGVAKNFNAIAKATTDASGEAVLRIQKDQTVRVVAKADGWTTEDSGEIRIGDGGSNDQRCGSFSLNLDGHSQSQSWCVVTDSNMTASHTLGGSEGRISIVLLKKQLTRSVSVSVGPHANAFVAVLPDGKAWASQHVPVHSDSDLQRLYMNRLVETKTTLTWRNNLVEQGDFELGVGCAREAPAARTSNNVPYLAQQSSTISIIKDWSPKNAGTWSSCTQFFVGPIVDTVNSQVTTKVTAELVFKGQSRIIPVGA